MHQYLFHIGDFPIRMYGLIMCLSIMLATATAWFLARQDGRWHDHVPDMGLYCGLAGIVGARLWDVFFFDWAYYQDHLLEIPFVWQGGMAIQGGVVAGTLVGYLYTKRHNIDTWEFADIVAAPAVILGQAIGRMANLLNGDAFGSPTGGNFGLLYPPGTLAHATYGTQPLWPTEVWEGQIDVNCEVRIGSWRLVKKTESQAKLPGRLIKRIAVSQKQRADLLQKLIEQRKRLENFIEGSMLATWEWNVQTGETRFNSYWAKIIGYSLEEISPVSIETWVRFAHPDDLANSNELLQKHFAGETEFYSCESRMRHKNGSWVWVRDKGRVVEWTAGGQPLMMYGVHVDITAEKQRSEELERFFSVNLDLLCIADTSGNFLKLNKAWEDILGYSVAELTEQRFLDFVHPDDIEATLQQMQILTEQDTVLNFVNRYRRKDGSYRYIEWRSHPYGSTIYAAARDITEHVETEKRIREISIRDPLTGIFNRRYIYERLEELRAEHDRTGKVFAICILDIDRFKNINDQHGHLAGDYILKEFARLIGGHLRPYDLLGRFGGEEFIVVLQNTDIVQATHIIERVLAAVRAREFEYDRQLIRFTFSAGVSNSCEEAAGTSSVESLIGKADARLYEAKRTGRNKVVG